MIVDKGDGRFECEHGIPVLLDDKGAMIGEFCLQCFNALLAGLSGGAYGN